MTALLRRAACGASGYGPMGRSVAGCAALLAGLTLTGCSLWNPHVTADMPRPQARFGTIEFAGNAAEAIDYANSWRTAYYDAVGDQAKLKNGMALVAIPAAATALYFGITGDSTREVITGLVTGTAGMLGVGTFLESSDRQKVYLAGSQALGCVILASSSLLVPKNQFEDLQLETDGPEPSAAITDPHYDAELKLSLVDRLSKAQQALATIQSVAQQMRDADMSADAALLAAQPEIKGAENLVSDSSETLGAADAFIARILSAEPEIVARVDNVVAKVSTEIVKTEPDIASITAITQGLSGAASRIGTIPAPKATPKAGEPAKTKEGAQSQETETTLRLHAALTAARQDLETRTSDLAVTAARVHAFLSAQNERQKALGKIDQCGLGDLAIGITLTPPGTDVSIVAGQNYNVIVSGGKRPYVAELAGAPAGVARSRSGFDQDPVIATVTTDATTKPGSNFGLAIADAAGNTTLINFTVTAAAAEPPATPLKNPTPQKDVNAGLGKFETQLNADAAKSDADKNKVITIQFGAGMRDAALTGKIDDATHAAVKKFLDPDGKKGGTGEVTADVAQTLLDNADATWTDDLTKKLGCNKLTGVKNRFECALSPTDLAALQAKLKVTNEENNFGGNTRNGIKANNPKGTDSLDALTQQIILALQ